LGCCAVFTYWGRCEFDPVKVGFKSKHYDGFKFTTHRILLKSSSPVIALIKLAYLRLGCILTNNEILQLIATTFDLNNSVIIEVFALADFNVTHEQVTTWLKKVEDEESLIKLNHPEMSLFLNGFINLKRGKRDGEQAKPQDHLNNNMVFQKLRIALNLKTEDILDVFKLVDMDFSKHEISAFFRKPGNKHYKDCRDNTLEKFLLGIQRQLRPDDNYALIDD
jgi:uncharacterized protein YehS (DUF1456 family)